jgi:hypothetical protein
MGTEPSGRHKKEFHFPSSYCSAQEVRAINDLFWPNDCISPLDFHEASKYVVFNGGITNPSHNLQPGGPGS